MLRLSLRRVSIRSSVLLLATVFVALPGYSREDVINRSGKSGRLRQTIASPVAFEVDSAPAVPERRPVRVADTVPSVEDQVFNEQPAKQPQQRVATRIDDVLRATEYRELPVANVPVPKQSPRRDQVPATPELNMTPIPKAVDAKPEQRICHRTKTTFYNPDDDGAMEGGALNRHNEKILAVQDAIRTGNPMTVAMDSLGDWGEMCNQRKRRCTVMVCNAGFDAAFPAYRKKFQNLPTNCFLGIVEDTGGRFKNKGTKKLDIPSRSRRNAAANPRGTEASRFQIVNNPCGNGVRARNCDLSARFNPDRDVPADACGMVAKWKMDKGKTSVPELEIQTAELHIPGAPVTTGLN